MSVAVIWIKVSLFASNNVVRIVHPHIDIYIHRYRLMYGKGPKCLFSEGVSETGREKETDNYSGYQMGDILQHIIFITLCNFEKS